MITHTADGLADDHPGVEAYGLHLTLRLSDIENRNSIEGRVSITNLLRTLVDRIGMRILAGPLIGEEEGIPEKRGWSGVVILYESHAAIHTYPETRQAFIDIFSCRVFDIHQVHEILNSFLGHYTISEQNTANRGMHWNTDVTRQLELWTNERAAVS